jgi:hypothetical protein
MMGDDHGRISAASKFAAKEIGCKVFKGSPYYRKEGVLLPPWATGTIMSLLTMPGEPQ